MNIYMKSIICTIALILFIHVGFLEYLSFKQFKLIVKMTRIESGVTIPKGLFTLYLNVKKVTAKNVLAAIVLGTVAELKFRALFFCHFNKISVKHLLLSS
jgi:hypothetical protein